MSRYALRHAITVVAIAIVVYAAGCLIAGAAYVITSAVCPGQEVTLQ